MDFIRLDKFITDENGMHTIEESFPKYPIAFYYDENDPGDGEAVRWRRHPQFAFLVALDNPVQVNVEDSSFILKKDEGAWINANRLYMIKCASTLQRDPADSFTSDSLSSSVASIAMLPEFIVGKDSILFQKYLVPIYENPDISFVAFNSTEPWHKEALTILQYAISAFDDKQVGFELAVRNAISQVWLLIVRHSNNLPHQSAAQPTGFREERIRMMLHFISENYAEHIALSDIAESAHISKSECIRCFKRNLDSTPIQYLTEYRLLTSKKYLASGYSVNSTALLCGFDDVSYFDKLFRKAYDITPSEFKTLNKQSEE